MTDRIATIEEALLNSMPAEKTVLLGGWVLRMNRNYTYRANCVCPLRYQSGAALPEKVEACEELFLKNRLPPVFKVTPVLQEGLAGFLLSRGYQKIKTVRAMLRGQAPDPPPAPPGGVEIESAEAPGPEWLRASVSLSGVTDPALAAVHRGNLKNIAVASVFVSAAAGGRIVGCGYGTAERGFAGIYDLHVDPEFRRRGIATAICRKIFGFGARRGAGFSYLIVHSKNRNAISLYSHLGFVPLYDYDFYVRPAGGYRIFDA